MEKIVIISATNRAGSNTLKLSKLYLEILKSLGRQGEILDLQNMPENILSKIMKLLNLHDLPANVLEAYDSRMQTIDPDLLNGRY